MSNKYHVLTPTACMLIWRSLALVFLCFYWVINDATEAGILFLLFLIITALARWRIEMPAWTTLFDQAICMVAVTFWSGAWFALAIPVFEATLRGKPWFLVPSVILLIMEAQSSLLLIMILFLAAFTGVVLYSWSHSVDLYKKEADQERRYRYELESFKRELLLASTQTAKMAKLEERNRISKSLHDHVGHELTGAILALAAFEQLWKEGDPQAEKLFFQAKERFSESSSHLRETVRNMKPVSATGLESFKEITEQFQMCLIQVDIYGNTSKVPSYLWGILEPALKESLTNVTRHSEATQVKVSLDVSESIVRLSIFNDGALKDHSGYGIGIRNLRQRTQSVGGSLSASSVKGGFQLVCVLPLEKDEQE